jgi:hypothetical protein
MRVKTPDLHPSASGHLNGRLRAVSRLWHKVRDAVTAVAGSWLWHKVRELLTLRGVSS